MIRRLFAFAVLFFCIAQAMPARAILPPSAFSYDASRPLDVRVARTWHEASTEFEDVTFASPYGRRIHAEIVLPSGTGEHPGVLFVHWLGDVKTTNLTEFLPDARALAERGITSVLVDAMWSAPSWFDKLRRPDTDFTNSIHQVVDLRRAIDLLQSQPNVNPRDVAFVGHDFGAMYGAVLSAVDARPSCYVLMAGTSTFSEWYLLGAPPSDKKAYVTRMRALDPPAYLAKATARQFLFQYSLHDEYVPLAAARTFAAAAPGESGVFFYRSDHSLRGGEISTDRLQWLESRLLSTQG